MKKKGKKKEIVTFFYREVWKNGEKEKVPYEWKDGEKEDYIKVCESVKGWGGVPLDVIWAKGTNSYIEAEQYLQSIK